MNTLMKFRSSSLVFSQVSDVAHEPLGGFFVVIFKEFSDLWKT